MVDEMIYCDGIFRHPEYSSEIVSLSDGSKTLVEMMHNAAMTNFDCDFLGTIDVENSKVDYVSYGQIYLQMHRVGKYLKELLSQESENRKIEGGAQKHPERLQTIADNDLRKTARNYKLNAQKQLIGIYSVNRAEWLISEFAIYICNSTNCPLYSTFGTESIKHILSETEMPICFVSGSKAKSLYEDVISKTSTSLRHVISYDDLSDDLVAGFLKSNIKLHFLKDILSVSQESSSEDSESITIQRGKDENSQIDHKGQNKMQERNRSFLETRCSETLNSITGNDIATVCYTSGTSGTPKGVILTHTNFISTAAGFLRCRGTNEQFRIAPGDTYLSYLPLAHVMERVCVLVFICSGARLCFFRGNPKCLQLDLKIAQPTFLVGVPRVFNVFKEKIGEEIEKRGKIASFVFNLCLKYKIFWQRRGVYKCKLLDKFIFSKIKMEFGGNLRAGMNGSAPMSGDVAEFLQAVFSMRIVQGYGQTEGTAANILTTLGDYSNERVGIPFPTNLVKLKPTVSQMFKKDEDRKTTNKTVISGNASHSEKTICHKNSKKNLQYIDTSHNKNINVDEENNKTPNQNDFDGKHTHSDKYSIPEDSDEKNSKITVVKGEILLKGPNITPGYYKRPDLTKDLFTEDGWLKTGDIGEINYDGKTRAFKIVGRRKEIFKTALGEYIVPEKIENALKNEYIDDILITGRSTGEFTVAIVVCKDNRKSIKDIEKNLKEKGDQLVTENVLTRFEVPRRILVLRNDFEHFGEMLTPTMKKKRSKIEHRFKKEIDDLYK